MSSTHYPQFTKSYPILAERERDAYLWGPWRPASRSGRATTAWQGTSIRSHFGTLPCGSGSVCGGVECASVRPNPNNPYDICTYENIAHGHLVHSIFCHHYLYTTRKYAWLIS
jgi:hypothetical protein